MKADVLTGLQQIPGPAGERFAVLMQHGSMKVEVYAPRGSDLQQPHRQDELYFVHSGHGEFLNGDVRLPFRRGDAFFVPAGQVHRFENFSNDFATWVVFYGPEGGENNHDD